MGSETSLFHPMGRRTFIKGVSIAAAALVLPAPWDQQTAQAAALTSGARMLRFAHVTDLHFTNRPQNRYPTSHFHIRQAVQDLNEQDLDFVLFTGDMFHFPQDMEAEMPILRDALKDLRVPYYCLFGNHDAEGDGVAARKGYFIEHIGDQGLSRGTHYYTFTPLPGLRFVMLDTTDVEGDAYHGWTGHMRDRQFNWLEQTLSAHQDETIFIGMHHPPLTPYPMLDKLRFDPAGSQRLLTILNGHPNVQLVLAGHYHFGGRNRFGPAELLLGPSLVEHPHPYRMIEVHQTEKGHGAIAYEWKSLNLHGNEDDACAFGTAGLRSFGLMRLSYNHNGMMPLALPS
jgi:predicted MPP superfamily phosphohydrolase